MFKRLICCEVINSLCSQAHAARRLQARTGGVSKLCLVAGAALALPAAWPLINEHFSGPLQAQLALALPDLVATNDGSPTEASPLPLPDDVNAADVNAASDDEPRFSEDLVSKVMAKGDPLLGDEPPFSDEPTFSDDAPQTSGERVVSARLVSPSNSAVIQRVSVLSAEDVKNLVTRARLELAAGDVELAHRFAEAAAEVPIPVDYFKSRPQLVLDEIEFHQQFQNADYKVAESSSLERAASASAPITTLPAPKITVPEAIETQSSDVPVLPLAEDEVTPVTPNPVVVTVTNALPVTTLATAGNSLETDLVDDVPPFSDAAAVSVLDQPAAPPLPEAASSEVRPLTLGEQPTQQSELAVDVKAAIEPAVAQSAPAQEAPVAAPAPLTPPKPMKPTERIVKTPRAYQALSQTKLSVAPRSRDSQTAPPKVPDSPARKQMAMTPAVKHDIGMGRNWGTLAYLWEAPSYYRSPLYFEEVQLERYGNEVPFVQPVLSAGHFAGTVATLPYQMWIEGNGPIACQYDLEQDRPGDCVPYSWQRLPWSTTGALAQTGTVLGLVFVIP